MVSEKGIIYMEKNESLESQRPNGGPRYVASLQDTKERTCFKDFHEGEKLEEAKQQADKAGKKHCREALVYDRIAMQIIYKFIPEKKEEPVSEVKEKAKKSKLKIIRK